MSDAPLAVFVYNRPQHTGRLLDSISKCEMAADTDLFIFADGYKQGGDAREVDAVRRLIKAYALDCPFRSCQVEESPTNRGLANSIIANVTKVIADYGRVIVLEDDLVVAPDLLRYMNAGLERYANDDTVWSVSGYSFPMRATSGKTGIFLAERGCSWGWATWADRWDAVDWSVADYSEFKSSHGMRLRFARGGGDLPYMLDDQMNGETDSWAIRWCYAASKGRKRTVYPCSSRVRNVGLDGSGTHSGITSSFDTELGASDEVSFEQDVTSEALAKEFADKYGKYWLVGLKRAIRRVLPGRTRSKLNRAR